MGMHTIGGERRHTQYRMAATGVPYALGVTGARCGPLRHPLELDAPDHRLQLGHPPVGTEALMQPAKARRMLALIHRFPALAVVLIRPHARPRSEEHTSELQSRENLVCRLLLEKKNQEINYNNLYMTHIRAP